MKDPIKILYSSGYKNVCLFYSVLTCISESFNKLPEMEKNKISVFLRNDILENIKSFLKTPSLFFKNSNNPILFSRQNIQNEIKNLSTNDFAEDISIFFLCEFFKINILIWSENKYENYARFFSYNGTDKYDNDESFIIIYNKNNLHFQPVKIMEKSNFKKTLMLKIRNENMLFLKDTDLVNQKILQRYIQKGYNADIEIDIDLMTKIVNIINEVLQ